MEETMVVEGADTVGQGEVVSIGILQDFPLLFGSDEVTPLDRTSISPPRYRAGHYSQSPSRFHDHELSFQRQERNAGPRTQAPFRAKQSQSPPVGNGHGVNVTEKSWSRRYYLFFTSYGALAGIQEETGICAVAES
ncbi:unnamed protein product [Sphagnum balticum]